MRKITADYIFTASADPIKDGVIYVNDENIITKIHKRE